MVFNIVGNLILIPRLGYVGAALATILSEFVLLFPFYYCVRRNVGVVPWWRVFGPPAIAAALMAAVSYTLIILGLNAWPAVLIGGMAYGGGLLLTGALRGDDMAAILRSLPVGPLRRLLPSAG